MTEQEIIEGNKLIVGFMESYDIGGEIKFIYTLNEPFPLSKEICTESNILEEIINEVEEFGTELSPSITWYHNSWDWLMPVVSKCLSNLDVLLRKNVKDSYSDDDWKYMGQIAGFKEKFKWCFERPDIDGCFNQVVEFIKWYNLCQKEK